MRLRVKVGVLAACISLWGTYHRNPLKELGGVARATAASWKPNVHCTYLCTDFGLVCMSFVLWYQCFPRLLTQ